MKITMDDVDWQRAVNELVGLGSGTHELCWECNAVIPHAEAIWRGIEINEEEQGYFDSYWCQECAIDAGHFPEVLRQAQVDLVTVIERRVEQLRRREIIWKYMRKLALVDRGHIWFGWVTSDR